MPSLFDALAASQQQSWTVSELTGYIRELFEVDFRLRDLQVTGEISNLHLARSGHLYFTLKDAKAQLKCVMWRDRAAMINFRPQDGDRVVADGRITVYEAGGVYQLYADHLRPAGRGDLAQAFERLKQQLAAEGLFDAEHKKPLPRFPQTIGIVTSADAAALRDILNVLERRYPLVKVLVAPTLVQGEAAPSQIVQALAAVDAREDVDLIILSRGGGSLEDLWAFNDERVARAIFAARHPVICGVGHETDVTIADYVADVRAPTPSAAAELAVPDRVELESQLAGLQRALAAIMQERLIAAQTQLAAFDRLLANLTPQRQLLNNRQRVDDLQHRLDHAVARQITGYDSRLRLAQARLTAVSPLATLARGYAIVRRGDTIVRSAAAAAKDERLQVQLHDGRLDVTVDDVVQMDSG